MAGVLELNVRSLPTEAILIQNEIAEATLANAIQH